MKIVSFILWKNPYGLFGQPNVISFAVVTKNANSQWLKITVVIELQVVLDSTSFSLPRPGSSRLDSSLKLASGLLPMCVSVTNAG